MPCKVCSTVFLPSLLSAQRFHRRSCIRIYRCLPCFDCRSTLSCCLTILTVVSSFWNQSITRQIDGWWWPTRLWNLLFHPSVMSVAAIVIDQEGFRVWSKSQGGVLRKVTKLRKMLRNHRRRTLLSNCPCTCGGCGQHRFDFILTLSDGLRKYLRWFVPGFCGLTLHCKSNFGQLHLILVGRMVVRLVDLRIFFLKVCFQAAPTLMARPPRTFPPNRRLPGTVFRVHEPIKTQL